MVADPQYDGARALEMLHQRYSIDYGSRRSGGRKAGPNDECHPEFFLDMLIIVGRPLRALTQINERFFDNVTVSFRHWRASYSAKHIHGFHFDLQHRTFRIASAATRESWFIVMHPVANIMTELLHSQREQRRRVEKSSLCSALQYHHAQFMAGYIKEIFHLEELLGLGVEASWMLDGPQSQNITFNKWTIFQEQFMQHWHQYVAEHTTDPFWHQHQPAFHAYDYGANIPIVVSDFVQSLSPEVSLRPSRDDDASHASDEEFEGSAAPLPADDDSFFVPDPQPSTSLRASMIESSRIESIVPPPELVAPEEFPPGLRQLHDELQQKYLVDHIQSISFALAVDINCLDTSVGGDDDHPARCLLADRNLVAQEFRGARDFTFYPLAFHPAYGNFSSPRPPAFLNDHVLAVGQDNMCYRNGGTDALTYGYFQAYSNIKRSIRHGPDDLLVTKGIATASLTLSEVEARASTRLQSKRHKLRRQLMGLATPDDPDASRPFAREERRIQASVEGEEFGFRMEQVIHVGLNRLLPELRSLATALQPVFQLMRFFLQEPDHYTCFLRSFVPTAFPGVLGAYARLFDRALNDLRARIDARGVTGAPVALAEGVAAIDRLGSYCFTGFPRSLMGSVLKPLGTIEGITHHAWPYFRPEMLDLLPTNGTLNLAQWPRGPNDRPILLHVAALTYHYGAAAALGRHHHVWFSELGGGALTGPSGITTLLEDFFASLWVPQMVAFVSFQLERHLRAERRHAEFLPSSPIDLAAMDQRRQILDAWNQSRRPFSWSEYEPVVLNLITPLCRVAVQTSIKARQDFSSEIYASCRSNMPRGTASVASPHATWMSVLRRVVHSIPSNQVSTQTWIAALSAAALSSGIECMPGVHRSRLSLCRVIRLIGYTTPAIVLAAPAGSLKRAAMEAQISAKRSRVPKRIDFGCQVPFVAVPNLLRHGFDSLQRHFQRGDQKVMEHYHVARTCLEGCLGDPLCDLLLMIVLTLASCSVTPTIAPGSKDFSPGKSRDSGSFAAGLATRMLWYLRPKHFPWHTEQPRVLRVSEMTKKLEHKGVNNRLLREIGWVKVTSGNRDSPRNTDLELQDLEKLLEMRNGLLSSMKDAQGFIRRVFHSHDSVWVDRCSAIIYQARDD